MHTQVNRVCCRPVQQHLLHSNTRKLDAESKPSSMRRRIILSSPRLWSTADSSRKSFSLQIRSMDLSFVIIVILLFIALSSLLQRVISTLVARARVRTGHVLVTHRFRTTHTMCLSLSDGWYCAARASRPSSRHLGAALPASAEVEASGG